MISIEASDSHAGLDLFPAEITVSVTPWAINPYRLTSWYEMLAFSAMAFFWCGRQLREIKTDCLIGSIPIGGNQKIFAVSRPLDDMAVHNSMKALRGIEQQFRTIELNITAETINDIIKELEKSPTIRRNFQWLLDQAETVEKLAERELRGKVFLYIPPERSKFFPTQDNPFPYPQSALKAFPSSLYDVNESVYCLAMSRSTAAVFHLMRILELGLTVLGNVFGVSLAHTNWAPALDQIESKIRDMHKDPVWKALLDCKEQQEFYAQSASHFGILKDAWRNYTMHSRGKYTQDEAEQIFANVKAFMEKLSAKLAE